MQNSTRQRQQLRTPDAPAAHLLPLIHAGADVAHWLEYYWQKLRLPEAEAHHLAVTIDRSEFHRWTGRRLNSLALGCYCYLPTAQQTGESGNALLTAPAEANAGTNANANAAGRVQLALPGFVEMTFPAANETLASAAPDTTPDTPQDYRHLIFVEPDLLPLGIEVTVAHELIHLADRVQGHPRKHRCHGYDSISIDEAAVTERDPEMLRALLREESRRREESLRRARPYRYLYVCPQCQKEYPRVRRYSRPVSCGRCDRNYNAAFLLELRDFAQPSRH
jgi:hypothetical protein